MAGSEVPVETDSTNWRCEVLGFFRSGVRLIRRIKGKVVDGKPRKSEVGESFEAPVNGDSGLENQPGEEEEEEEEQGQWRELP